MNEKFKDELWIPFNETTDFIKIYEEALKKANNNDHDNIRKRYRFFSLYQLVYLSLKNNKDYNFVECGCFKGQSSYIIADILKKQNFKNKFFIFDSFEGGLSEYSTEDKVIKHNKEERIISLKEETKRRKKFENSFADFENLISPFNFIEVHKSWIPNDFYKIEDQKFQFVHIDVDLYQPTYDCLEFFFPRLVNGGIIVCDDYNFLDFPGAKKAWDDYFVNKEYFMSYEVPLGSKFLIK